MNETSLLDRKRILASHFLFGQLTDDELDKLLLRSRVEKYKAGDIIFLKGSPGSGMMAVLHGRIRITSPSPDGKEVILNVIREGEVFGEIALLDGKERTADAVAASDCDLLVIERRDFIPFLETHPSLMLRLLGVLCERLRRTTEQVEDVLFLDLQSRLAKQLLQLGAAHGRKTPQGIQLSDRLSQREIGNMVGLSRESINKQLNTWQREGLIAIENGVITLKRTDALRDLADGT